MICRDGVLIDLLRIFHLLKLKRGLGLLVVLEGLVNFRKFPKETNDFFSALENKMLKKTNDFFSALKKKFPKETNDFISALEMSQENQRMTSSVP